MNPVELPKPKKQPKYHNVKTVVDGIKFDSKRESIRYQHLKLLERRGEITELRLQVPFEIFPAQRRGGRVVEHSCKYIADFTYLDKDGNFVCEDSKGTATKDYLLKRKAMLFFHDIQIKEV